MSLYDEEMQDPEMRRLMGQERLIDEAQELIIETIREVGTNISDLANNLGKSERYVKRLLLGTKEIKLRDLADIMYAMGKRVVLKCEDTNEANY